MAASLTALADDPQAMAPQVPGAQALLTQPVPTPDASATPDPAAGLQSVPTEISVRVGKSGHGKASAGDVVVLTVKPGAELGQGATPIESAKLEKGPVEWGDGRILWWKPFDEKTGAITIGVTTYKPSPNFKIKAIPFYRDSKAIFATEPKEVEFTAVGGDKMKDDIYEPSRVDLPLWVWILIALLSLGLALGAIKALSDWNKRRRSKLEELANAPRVLTPIEEFEKVRRETDSKAHVERANFKPHYFALSDGAKRFLARAWRFDAEERTTRELLYELERLGMKVDLIDKWERLFDEMDVVKFTDQAPETEHARSLAGRLSQVVSASYAESPMMREILAQQQAELQKKRGLAT